MSGNASEPPDSDLGSLDELHRRAHVLDATITSEAIARYFAEIGEAARQLRLLDSEGQTAESVVTPQWVDHAS